MFLKSIAWNFVLNSKGILVWRFFVGGFGMGFCPGGFVPEVFVRGGLCPDTVRCTYHKLGLMEYSQISQEN